MAFDEPRDEPEFLRNEQDYGEPPAKKGWSTGAKVALVLGIIFVVALVACCGFFGWFATKVGTAMTQDAGEINTIREGMLSEIDLPEGWDPQVGMNFTMFGQGMQMAIYSPGQEPGDGGMLMLLQMQIQADPAQMRDQMKQAFNQSGQQEIVIESSETRTLTIDGEEVDFQFAKGKTKDGNQDVRQVQGVVTGNHGTVVIVMVVPEESWDEEVVVRTLESIRK